MSAYDLVFCNPSLDSNHPISGSVLVNASPVNLLVVVGVELTRDPNVKEVRAVLRGLDTTEQAQEHIFSLVDPPTVHRSTIVVRLAAMKDGQPRRLTAEVLTPGAVLTVRILSADPV